ncbi:MAG: flagellar hook-length control protein FliK [Clostridiaceae bacterium]|nr:flagellar hook-length control protein FliK [Clostridiaceae bacterium]
MDTIYINPAISQQVFQIPSKAVLENLKAGDILRGRVQSEENGMLLIILLDGSSFTASIPQGLSIEVGETVILEIGERLNNQLTAKLINVEAESTGKADGESALINIIKSNLDSFGVAVTQRLISDVLDLIKQEPGISTDKASFMVANGLSKDPGMTEVLQKISEHEFSLHENLLNLKEELANALIKAGPETASNLIKPLVISQETEELSYTLKEMLSGVSPGLARSIEQNVRELLIRTLMDEFGGAENGTVRIDKEALDSLVKSALQGLENRNVHDETTISKLLLTPQNEDALLKAINKALENIHKKAGNTENNNKSPELQKAIKEILDKLFDKVSIKVQNGVAEDIDIKEKNRALKGIMNFSQKILNNSDQNAKTSIMHAYKEIGDAFRFFNQVTTYDAILQLPIKINKENTTGELYVMKRKKGRKKIDIENFTLFLSLTTKNLGIVEAFLNSSQKCITISFRVEDENLVKMVKNNYRVLYDGLLEKGFRLVDMKCRVLEKERANPVNAAKKAQELLGTKTRVDLKI